MLFLLPLFAIGQNRFEKEFIKADSAFYEQTKKAAVDHVMEVQGKDSIEGCCSRVFYDCLYEIEKSNKVKNILISENDYLHEYMNGYMIGQLSFYYNKGFSYNVLESKLKKIKRELRKIKNL